MSLYLLAAFFLLFQGPADATKASIEGVVVRSGAGEPLIRAQVTLTRVLQTSTPSPPPPIPAAMTERDGKFLFKDLDPGPYQLRVARGGYAAQEYGQKTPQSSGTIITLTPGQQMKDVVFRMIAAGTVTGRVRDTSGEPVTGLQVSLFRSSFNIYGQRVYNLVGAAITDDRGEYRAFWVPAGRYIVGASVLGPTQLPGGVGQATFFGDRNLPLTYYPGTQDVTRASTVDVQEGREVGAIDILVAPVATFRVRGRLVDGTTGKAPQGGLVSLVPRQEQNVQTRLASNANSNSVTYNFADGTFEIRNVIPGTYFVRAQGPATIGAPGTLPGRGSNADVPIDVVGADIEGVVVTMTQGISIPMHLSVDGQELSTIAGYDRVRVLMRQSSASTVLAGNQQGTFTPEGVASLNVTSGEYRIVVSLPSPDLYVKEAMFARSDVLHSPWLITNETSGTLSIVLSTKGGQLEGKLVDALSQAARGQPVTLIPDQNRDRYELYKTVTTDTDGRFTFRGVAPGSYKVFSWESLEPNAYFDREVLAQYESHGKPVRIQESSKETIDLKFIPAPK